MPRIEDMYPLSPMQHGLLFHSLLHPEAGLYVPQVALSLSGAWSSSSLRQAAEDVVRRHTVLRTGFQWELRDEPFQIVYRDVDLPWAELDWSAFSAREQQTKLENLIAANRGEPFRLQRPPLMRMQWIRRGSDSFYLLCCYHHLILDGWSASNLIRELLGSGARASNVDAGASHSAVDAAMDVGIEPPASYSRYIAWLRKQDQTAAERFWRERFAARDSYPSSYLPRAQHGDDSQRGAKPAVQHAALTEEQSQDLRRFLQDNQITLNS
ncbi:MAG: condensation domain-containing protein, partial [Planctomycetota bacterium]